MRSLLARLTSTAILLLAVMMPAIPAPASAQANSSEPPTFSVQRGFYTNPFNLTLSSPGAEIRYTLDGSTPTASYGEVYTGPIAISTTTSVRAVAYTTTSLPSPVVTHSYIFLAAVRTQADTPLPGWPTSFAVTDLSGSYPADYGMDPEVTEHPNNSAKFETVMKALPSLSIVTDLPNLWNPGTGIYYRPNAKNNSPIDPLGTTWERPTSLEWINPDGTTGFEQLAGVSIEGETSRRPHRQPKKEFRLSFNPKYGTAGLDFELFDYSDPVASFDQLILRNGGNHSWSYFDRDQRRITDYVNDEWSRRVWGQMGNLETHGTYVHLYLNGLYWGLYNVTERLDASFLQSYLGLTAADYDIVQAGDDAGNYPVATAGTVNAWNEVITLVSGTDPVSDTLYQTIEGKVDVVNLADYFVHAHYIGKTDWPEHNWNAYRAKTGSDTRFKFTPLNNDTSLNKVTENTTVLTDSVGLADAPAQLFLRLTTNPEFRQVLADRLYKHVADSTGALSPANCAALYTQLTNTIDQAVIAESARWGDYMRDKYPSTNAAPKGFPAYLHSRDLPNLYTDPGGVVLENEQKTWVNIRDEKLASYCPARSGNVVNQYIANGWYQTAVKAPSFSKQGGTVAANSSVTISNSPNSNAGAIYYTTNGTDPRQPYGAIAAGATNGADSASVTISQVTTVKARVLNGAAWSPLVEYTFYPAQAFSNLIINEIHYNPLAGASPAAQNANDFEFIELHNKGNTALRLDEVSFKSGIFFRFPANTTLGAGQYLVLASDSASFQSRYGFAPFGDYQGSLSNTGETLELIDPVGAVIDTVAYQSVAPWAFGANGGGGSLSLSSPSASNSDAANWFASTINGGTPGASNSSSPAGKKVPQITWTKPTAITYGTLLGPQLNAAVTDSGQPVPGVFTYSPAPGAILHAGNNQVLRVVFTPDNSASYAAVNAAVLIDVTKAPLTITANNKVKAIGAVIPPLTASYTGFVNGEDPTVLDTPAVLNTVATVDSPLGVYPITVSGASDSDYAITFVEGTLTVTDKAVPTITWPEPAAITYGTPLSSAQLNATATENGQPVAGTFSYTPGAGTVLQAGNDQALSVTFTPANGAAYVSVTHNITIDVAKAQLTIQADNKIKQVGTTNPPLTASYGGFVNGDTVASLDAPAVLSTTATTESPAGSYPITVSGAVDANYAIIFLNGTLTVTEEPVVTQYRVMLPMLLGR